MSDEFDRLIPDAPKVDMYLLLIQTDLGRQVMASRIEPRLVAEADPKTFQTMVDESEYKQLLINAAQSRSFEPTRQYIIRILSNHPKPNDVAVQPFKRSYRSTGLELAFREEYVGTAVDGLYKYLTSCGVKFRNPGARYRGRFLSVVQSSGTGKSRTINQLMQTKVLGLYMNVRLAEDTNSYPKRDKIPARILTENLHCPAEEYASRCISFFTAIFTVIREELIHKQGAKAVSNETVKEKYEQMLEKFPKEYDRAKVGGHKRDDAIGLELLGKRFMIEAYQELIRIAPEFFDETTYTPKFVIAIDEAHTLGTSAHILCQVIGSFNRSEPVTNWVVFVSTAAEIADFSAPACDPRQDREELFTPYSQLGWDQLATPSRKIKLRETAQLGNIIGFGRPLWKSLLASSLSTSSILKTAGQKLCYSLHFNESDSAQALAILGQRFCLDVRFGHSRAIELQSKAVSNHLRYSLRTTPDRVWQTTLYPSEPILSCASAYFLYWTTKGHGDSANLAPSLARLWEDIRGGAVDISKKGELVPRLIYLLAKDLFVRTPGFSAASMGPDFTKDLLDCRMVPVVDYLEFVFGPSVVLGEVKNAFSGWYINFSHWICMSGVTEFNESTELKTWLMRHWVRTCAIQCCHNQRAIDKLIPMYKEPANSGDPYDGCMSYILISDRAGKPATKDLKLLSPAGAGIPQLHQPYVAIRAELRLNGEELEFELDTTSSTQALRIHAPGVNTATYPFLGTDGLLEVQYTLQKMLDPPVEGPEDDVAFLENQVEYGDTVSPRHMKWEMGRGE